MSDPISTSASVLSISAAALQSVQFLVNSIKAIKDAPKAVIALKDDLQALESALRSLRQELDGDNAARLVNEAIRSAVENCNRASTAFKAKLDQWTRHSTTDKTVWLDRTRIAPFEQGQIKSFTGQVNASKNTLNVALSTAAVLSLSRRPDLRPERRSRLLEENMTELRSDIARAESEQQALTADLQRLSTTAANASTPSPSQSQSQNQYSSHQDLISELRRQQAANDAFKEMCEDALRRMAQQQQRTEQEIDGVSASDQSVALAGLINVPDENVRIGRQKISNISAAKGSFVFSGMAGNLDVGDVLSFARSGREYVDS